MSGGRTMWFAQDVARHRRALIVELQDEFGPVALALDNVLCAHAKEQNDGGAIRDGFASLAREAGMAGRADEVRAFVERAAAVGWLDDLNVDPDGRRFTCRVSGWRNDQDRATAAWRKAAQRAKDEAGQTVTDRDKGETDRDKSRSGPKCPPTAQHSTGQKDTPLPHGFEEWLTDHQAITGHKPSPPTTQAYKDVVASYAARRAEGWTLDQLKAATRGAYNDEYRREHGYTTATSVLRPKKIGDLVARGEAKAPKGKSDDFVARLEAAAERAAAEEAAREAAEAAA